MFLAEAHDKEFVFPIFMLFASDPSNTTIAIVHQDGMHQETMSFSFLLLVGS